MYHVGSMAYDPNYLEHHGILGMKWGVRRYQNADGSLTAKGKIRYYQTAKGDYKKRGVRDRGYQEGVARMTGKHGEKKSLTAALWKNHGAASVRSLAKLGLLGAAVVGAHVVAPNALIALGAKTAGSMFGPTMSTVYATHVADLVGMAGAVTIGARETMRMHSADAGSRTVAQQRREAKNRNS